MVRIFATILVALLANAAPGEAVSVRGGFPDFRVTGAEAMKFVIVELK